MAISSEYPGLEVNICVRSQQLHEYDDDEDPPPKTTTKYIEARSDSKFVIATTFRPQFPNRYHIRTQVSIDGVSVMGSFCDREQLFQKTITMGSLRRQQDGEWVKEKFCFAKLNIVEETYESGPSVATLKQSLSTKGCITVSFRFVESYRDLGVYSRPFKNPRKELAALKEIPEKALKGDALSHQAVLSKPQKCRPGNDARRAYDYVDQEPFATFHFKYRSLASLKALRIVSTSESTPVPLEDRPEEDLTPAELRELLRRVRQREAETDSIKQEARTTARVKHERTIDDEDEVTYVETRQRRRPHVDREIIVID